MMRPAALTLFPSLLHLSRAAQQPSRRQRATRDIGTRLHKQHHQSLRDNYVFLWISRPVWSLVPPSRRPELEHQDERLHEPKLLRLVYVVRFMPALMPLPALAALIGVGAGGGRLALAAGIHAGLEDIVGCLSRVGHGATTNAARRTCSSRTWSPYLCRESS
jgi:hypothetical protein